MKNKNIIVVFSDQQRPDTIGCYGQKLPVTPNLDKMAEEGIKFENAFTVNPVCGPTRSTMQLGVYPTESGCYRNDIGLPKDKKTVANFLSEKGYEVGYIGKWHLASNDAFSSDASDDDVNNTFTAASSDTRNVDIKKKNIVNHAFTPIPKELRGGYNEFWVASDLLEGTSHGYGGFMFDKDGNKVEWDENTYRADFLTDLALDYLGKQEKEKPFYLFLSYLEPHHQNDRNTYEGPNGSLEKWKEFEAPEDLKPFNGNWKEEYPDYLGCCNSIDMNLGRIRNSLKENNLEKDTVIIYLSDHGSHFKTRNDEYKRSCHDSSIKVPLIIFDPQAEPGQEIEEFASIADIVPTVLRAGGTEVPDYMPGKTLQDYYLDKKKAKENISFIQISESQVGRAIRTDKWLYSVSDPLKDGWNDSYSDTYKSEFLYDLECDPNQLNNLVENKEYEEDLLDLKEILIKNIEKHEGRKAIIA